MGRGGGGRQLQPCEKGSWVQIPGSQVLGPVRLWASRKWCEPAFSLVCGLPRSVYQATQPEVAGAASLGKTSWGSYRGLQGTPEPYV